MNFENVLALARNGGKFRRPAMGLSYITITNVADDSSKSLLLPRLILVVDGVNHITFTMSNMDLSATDWEDTEPVVKVKMFASFFKIVCTCGRTYSVGEKWELHTGDVFKCTCGNRLLLEPPVLVESTTPTTLLSGCTSITNKTIDKIDPGSWPKA